MSVQPSGVPQVSPLVDFGLRTVPELEVYNPVDVASDIDIETADMERRVAQGP